MKLLECQVYSYMVDRHIVPIKISMFKSKRKGTASARILIPSNGSEKVLSESFWPKFMHCKLWQQNERTRDSVDQNDMSTTMKIPVRLEYRLEGRKDLEISASVMVI